MLSRTYSESSPTLGFVSSATSLSAACSGLLVLLGWITGIESIKRVITVFVAMNPMTALLFIALGLALWLKCPSQIGRSNRIASALAMIVVVAAASKLIAHIVGAESGIDTWLFRENLAGAAGLPNRMAPNTAINFVLLGLAVTFLDTTSAKGNRPSELFAGVAGCIAFLALLGYAYRIPSMVGYSRHIPMALNTAVTFLLICVSIFASRPRIGWMALVTSKGPGGEMSRLMLPSLILTITGMGWLRVYGESLGFYTSERGVSTYTLTIIILCISLTLWSARLLDKASKKQIQVEQQREGAFSDLQQSEARIRSILDTTYDAFVSIDAHGTVLDWNGAAEKMFGRPRAECVGKSLTGLIVPLAHQQAHEEGLARARSAAGPKGNFLNRRIELTALNRDGDEFPIQMTIWPLMVGERSTFNAFIADITERTAAERRIQVLHAQLVVKAGQLENSNDALEAFSYSISHDLRAPLRHIDGYARMLQEDAGEKLAGEPSRYLEEIGEAARRMGALIDNLLTFSRLGRKAMQISEIDMASLINEVLKENPLAMRAHIKVGELPSVFADPVLLKQVWTNLVSNAVKYSAPRGDGALIHIDGEHTNLGVRYQIRDNGVGFDVRYIDKLFGVFQRLHTDEEFEGSGVGLAIIKRIINLHGGTISATATLGVGATFSFEMPNTAQSE